VRDALHQLSLASGQRLARALPQRNHALRQGVHHEREQPQPRRSPRLEPGWIVRQHRVEQPGLFGQQPLREVRAFAGRSRQDTQWLVVGSPGKQRHRARVHRAAHAVHDRPRDALQVQRGIERAKRLHQFVQLAGCHARFVVQPRVPDRHSRLRRDGREQVAVGFAVGVLALAVFQRQRADHLVLHDQRHAQERRRDWSVRLQAARGGAVAHQDRAALAHGTVEELGPQGALIPGLGTAMDHNQWEAYAVAVLIVERDGEGGHLAQRLHLVVDGLQKAFRRQIGLDRLPDAVERGQLVEPALHGHA